MIYHIRTSNRLSLDLIKTLLFVYNMVRLQLHLLIIRMSILLWHFNNIGPES